MPSSCSHQITGTLGYHRHTGIPQAHWDTTGTLGYHRHTGIPQAHWDTTGTLGYHRHTGIPQAHWDTTGILLDSRYNRNAKLLPPAFSYIKQGTWELSYSGQIPGTIAQGGMVVLLDLRFT